MTLKPPFRKRTLEPAPAPRVGLAWYTEEEWARVKRAAVDPSRFESTFAEWLTIAEETLARIREAGAQAETMLITADGLLAWCRTRQRPNDAAARASYVAWLMDRRPEQHGATRLR